MPKIEPEIKEAIVALSRKDLEKLVLKAVSMNKQFHDYLLINYVNTLIGEKELFEEAREDIEYIIIKGCKGYSEELRLANILAACNKRISEFSKVCKDKSLEMDLILHVLKIPFTNYPNSFQTCFTRFNQQVYLLVKKAITLLNTKIHEDYRPEYTPVLNQYLHFLHTHSNHLDYIYNLPQEVEYR
jgi:hypothetical protein